MMIFKNLKRHFTLVLNILVVLYLLLLPYTLFRGKYFIGGDDTRIFYYYPIEYLIHTQFFSWTNLSSFGWNFSYQTFLPFVLLWSLLELITQNHMVIGYLAFSLPLIFGLVFFQKLMSELIIKDSKSYQLEFLLGSLFYVLSPVIINNHYLNPLIPIWLIGLIPAVTYFFLRFLKNGNILNIIYAVFLVTFFSFGTHNIPWIAGFLIPTTSSIVCCSVLFNHNQIFLFIKKIFIFFSIIVLSQSFWIFGLAHAFLGASGNSFTSKVTSENFTSNFERSVFATSQGTTIYPFLNHYQRQIAFDFGWELKKIFISYYDKTYLLSGIYIFIIFFGIISFRKYLNQLERKIFTIILFAFIFSLYLFTINIGPLYNIYLLLGKIPGFILFRNPYDKFAMGYGIIFSVFISYALVIFKRKYSRKMFRKIVLVIFMAAIIVSAIPLTKIITSPLWTTETIHKNIMIPPEYLNFMNEIKSTVPSSNNILSIPYGLSLYTIIKDADSDNVYAGVSPVIIFSGVNDISGYLSFNYAPEGELVNSYIENRNYKAFNDILYTHNINYVLVTKNIPTQVKKSYLFVDKVLATQDEKFIENITDKKIITSTQGNYELYTTKKRNLLISSDNLSFIKRSRVKYSILVKNLNKKQKFLFNDTFHEGWKLYLQPKNSQFNCKALVFVNDLKTTECEDQIDWFDFSDILFITKDAVFEKSHVVNSDFSSEWVIDPEYIKDNFDQTYYAKNEDGSIDIELVLYFKPQVDFYIGIAVSLMTVGFLLVLFVLRKK